MAWKGNSTTYPVRNAEGQLVANHVRKDKPDGTKEVCWMRPDGRWGLNGTPLDTLPLYGSERVSGYDPDKLIILAEGEKATEALLDAGFAAVGTVTGARTTPGRAPLEVLRDRRVVLWADNDDDGRAHMERVARALDGTVAELLHYTWNEAPEKGDAADHPAIRGKDAGAVDLLRNDLRCAPAWRSRERNGEVADLPVGRLLSEVVAERVCWLWEKRIPLGKLTIVEGDPGLGKSALLIDLAARVSVGRPLPDGSPCEAGGVVICSAEDGVADTIRPRLDAAGGDPDKVLDLATVEDGYDGRFLSIPEDMDVLRRAIERVDAKLVIVDPLTAFLSGKLNAHKDQDVRRGLTPLARLAEEKGAAVVVVRHLNKAEGGNPLYRGGMSIGIIGTARSALLVAKDPEDDRRRVLAPQKGNLAKLAPSLAFVLEEAPNGAVRVEWKGETTHTANSLLAAPANPKRRSAREEAIGFLRDILASGPVLAEQVEEDARAANISDSTLKRAKNDLGIVSKKGGGNGPWSWRLPRGKGTKEGQASESDLLEPLDPLASTGHSLE